MYIGIDIGGTSIKYGLVDSQGQVSETGKCRTDHSLAGLIDSIKEIVKKYQENVRIEGVGVSAPGIIQADGYMTTGGAIRELYGVNLKELVSEAVGLPVAVENDGNAAAVAEQWTGNAKGKKNYIVVVLGSGMGGGIVINNEVYRGAHGMAGEFGFMVTKSVSGEDVEASSLNKTASVIGGICYQYNLISGEKPVYDAVQIMAKAEENDAKAVEVMDNFYHHLSIGLMNLISSFDPEVVLIGGGISANETFMPRLKQTIHEMESKHGSISGLMNKTFADVLPAKLKNNAGLIGAVYQLHKHSLA